MKRILVLLLPVLLAACATPEWKAQRMMAKYGPQCTALGYKPDTDPWRQCIQTAHSDKFRAYGIIQGMHQ